MNRLLCPRPRTALLYYPAAAFFVIFASSIIVGQQQDPDRRTEQPAKSRPPEPDKADQAKAEKILAKMFKDEIAKAKSDQAVARELADVLLREARQTNEDPPLRFVALVLSRDLAAQSGDIGTAMAAIEELDKHYAVETLGMKTKMLSLAAAKAASKDDHQGIVEMALNLLEDALADDNYSAAEELIRAAEESATKSKNLQTAARVEKRMQEVDQAKKEFTRMQNFIDLLTRKPDDPVANGEMGRYFCLVKGNWERGLPMLIKGGDKNFLDIAKRDIAKPQEVRAQLELGDEFATLADAEKGLAQKMLYKRAHFWYSKCLPGLEGGLNKLRVERAVEEIAKLFPASNPIAMPSASGASITTLVRTFDKAHFNGVQALAISPDNKWVISGGIQEGIARIWNLSEGKQVRQLQGHKNEVWGVAFSLDGSQCATGSTDQTLRTWDTNTGNPVRTYLGHVDWVRGVHYLPDKKHILTASDDKTLRLWDIASGNMLKQMSGHTNFINSLSVSRDGKRAATGSLDMSLRVWNIDKGEEIAKFLLQHEVWSVAISPDGKRVVAATVGNICKLYDVDGKKEIMTLQVPSRVWSVAFAPNGKSVAVGTGGLVNTIPPGTIEGGWPQKGGVDNGIYFFEIDSGKPIRRLAGHTMSVRALAYSIDGRFLVSGGDDNLIRLWGERK